MASTPPPTSVAGLATSQNALPNFSTLLPTVALAIQEADRREISARPGGGVDQGFWEIRNLVWAKNDEVFKVALEEWDRDERTAKADIEFQEKRGADLVNQIFTLVGIYSVFLGVVLTAVSQLGAASDSNSQCGKIWFPMLLTVVAAVGALIGLLKKFKDLNFSEHVFDVVKLTHAALIHKRRRLLEFGEEFRFCSHTMNVNLPEPRPFGINKFFVIGSLILVTGVFNVCYWVILCDLGD